MANEKNDDDYFHTAGPEAKKWYLGRIEPQSDRLLQNEVSSGQMVISLLAGANAGGSVAMLAYISSPGRDPIPHSTGVLALFLVGFVVALLLAAYAYYLNLFRLVRWNSRLASFYRGDTSWRGLWADRHVPWARLTEVLGWLSFIFFAAGAGLGIVEIVSQ